MILIFIVHVCTAFGSILLAGMSYYTLSTNILRIPSVMFVLAFKLLGFLLPFYHVCCVVHCSAGTRQPSPTLAVVVSTISVLTLHSQTVALVQGYPRVIAIVASVTVETATGVLRFPIVIRDFVA